MLIGCYKATRTNGTAKHPGLTNLTYHFSSVNMKYTQRTQESKLTVRKSLFLEPLSGGLVASEIVRRWDLKRGARSPRIAATHIGACLCSPHRLG